MPPPSVWLGGSRGFQSPQLEPGLCLAAARCSSSAWCLPSPGRCAQPGKHAPLPGNRPSDAFYCKEMENILRPTAGGVSTCFSTRFSCCACWMCSMRGCVGEEGAPSPVPAVVSPGLGVAWPRLPLIPHRLAGAITVACQGFSWELASNDSWASTPPIISSLALSENQPPPPSQFCFLQEQNSAGAADLSG